MANEFNPSLSVMRHAAELYTVNSVLVPGVARGGVYVDERLHESGETLASEAPTIPVPTIQPRGQRTKGLPSKFDSQGDAQSAHDSEAAVYWLAQWQERGDAVTTLDTGAYEHVLKNSATAKDYRASRTIRVSRDTGFIHTLLGARMRSANFSFTPRNVVLAQREFCWEHETYHDLATVLAGTSPPILIRGLYKQQNNALADGDLFAKVTAISSGVSATVQFKVGAAAVYGAAGELTIPLNTWTPITSATTVPGAGATGGLGYTDDPLWAYVPGNQVVNDEYRYDFYAPTLWWPAFGALEAFNEIHVTVTIGGTEYRVRAANLNLQRPGIQPQVNVGRRRLDPIRVQGQRVITGSLNRRLIDNNLSQMLEEAREFALRIKCESREPIAATAYTHELQFDAPVCIFNGKRATITSPEDFPEALNFDVFTDGTNDLVITARNAIADMAL